VSNPPPTLEDIHARREAFQPPAPRSGGRVGLVLWLLTAAAHGWLWFEAFGGVGAPAPGLATLLALSALPVVVFLGLCWIFVLWTATPDSRLAPWVLLGALAAPGAHWGPSWRATPPAQATTSSPVESRVLTWNLRRLWGTPAAEKDSLNCVAEQIRELSPDLLFLQEVTAKDLRRLGKEAKLTCGRVAYRDGDAPDAAGHAVCSRGSAWRVNQAAAVRPAQAHWRQLKATATHGDTAITLHGLHLPPFPKGDGSFASLWEQLQTWPTIAESQQHHIESLLSSIQPEESALIAGDFNTPRDLPLHAKMRTEAQDTWEVGASGWSGTTTLGGVLPTRVDYIYASPHMSVLGTQIPDTECSDHRPVVTDLRISR